MRIRLVGGGVGRIPLADLGELAGGVQEAVLRIARSRADRSGPGRTPEDLKRWTTLDATGIEAGSAILVVEAPGREQQQLPLEGIEEDPGLGALADLDDALDALGHGQPLPSEFDQLSEQALRRMLARLTGYELVEWSHQANGVTRTITLSPRAIGIEPPEPSQEHATPESLVGRLYQVNLRSHGYGIEDDMGRVIHCDFPGDGQHLEEIRRLVGRQVAVMGTAFRDDVGKIERFQVDRISAADQDEEGGEFFSFDLASALAARDPVDDLSSLRIDELTDVEAAEFWRAINE